MPTLDNNQLHAGQLITATGEYRNPQLTLTPDGSLLSLTTNPDPDPNPNPADTTLLAPALLDIHTHGAVGEDVMSATPAGFAKLGRFYATHGVAWYCPTTATAAVDTLLAAVERIATQIERGPQPLEAQPIGIHLEGPFLSAAKRGVHPAEHLLPPDVATFDRLHAAARGHILLLTLAPELPGALDLIRHATGLGIRVSLGHSDATAAQTLAAVDAGATGATHTFNAMRPLDHREPGILGTALDDPRVYAELIADTVHVAPPLIRLWWRAKGPTRSILVTDSMPATGSGDGHYTLADLPVTVSGGRALLTAGLAQGKHTLAGSLLTLDVAVANLHNHTGCPLPEAIRAAATTPAAYLGQPDLTTLTPGHPVPLIRLNKDGQLLSTYLRGREIPAAN